MKCTSCNSGELIPAHLETMFPCHTCNNCGGELVLLADYLRWRDENEDMDFTSDNESQVEVEDTPNAILCPITGRLMTKYRISKDIDHRLDLSWAANAIWMDKGEWALLKQNGLAGKLSDIFSDHWQREIQSATSAEILEEMYQERFGEQYQMINEFRQFLDSMENKSEVIAYLLADDSHSTD